MALSDWLSAEGCTQVVMEATGVYWKPILADGEFTMVLANAAHVKNVTGRKTDVNDATWLADLVAHGLIRASFVPDEQTQEMRNFLRTRKQFVRERSSHILRIPEDAGRRQHQARFADYRHHRPVRPQHDRGLDCR
jgi:transposase